MIKKLKRVSKYIVPSIKILFSNFSRIATGTITTHPRNFGHTPWNFDKNLRCYTTSDGPGFVTGLFTIKHGTQRSLIPIKVDIFTVPLQYSSTAYTAIRQASDVTACSDYYMLSQLSYWRYH